MRRIALIPARGGSKRIPFKNIKPFCGQPIIAYSIQNALESKLFEQVVVSTDSEQIAQIALDYGASVPFLRPEHLSDDFTPTAFVAIHAAEALGLQHQDLLCVIYPTAPLLQLQSLVRAEQILSVDSEICFVFGAVRYEYSPFRSFTLSNENGINSLDNNEGKLQMLFPEYYSKRSQDLPQVYHDAGQFYFGRVGAWKENLCIFGIHSRALMLPSIFVQDIDTLEDWERAEEKYRVLKTKKLDRQG